MPSADGTPQLAPLLAEMVATRSLVAELRRRVEAQDLQVQRAARQWDLSRAIREFAHLVTRPRAMLGLTWRCLLGRTQDVRRHVEIMLRQSNMPPPLDMTALWIAKPRVIFGLARRQVFGGRLSAKGVVVLELERKLELFDNGAASWQADLAAWPAGIALD